LALIYEDRRGRGVRVDLLLKRLKVYQHHSRVELHLLLLRNEERLGDLEGLLLVEVQEGLEEGKELFNGNYTAAIVKAN
jgi:hypothetical protein